MKIKPLSNSLEILRNAPFTSKLLSKDLYSRVIDRIDWLIQKSPGLNPDWFSVIRLFSIRYSKFCCKLFFQRFWCRLRVMIPAYNFSPFVYHLILQLALHWPFPHSDGKPSSFNEALKIYCKGLWKDSPNTF